MTYSPGTWKAVWLDQDHGWIVDARGRYLAEIVTSDSEGRFASPDEQRGNAEVMALAPQLVHLVASVLAWARTPGNHGGNPYRHGFVKEAEQIEAAIWGPERGPR